LDNVGYKEFIVKAAFGPDLKSIKASQRKL
jgi:hypothetical protein